MTWMLIGVTAELVTAIGTVLDSVADICERNARAVNATHELILSTANVNSIAVQLVLACLTIV